MPAVIIPIGHDKGVRRLPIVTVVIIIACTVLQLYRSFGGPSVEELSRKHDERLAIIEQIAGDLYRRDRTFDPEPMIDGDYSGIDHPLVADLVRVDQELGAIVGRDLAVRFGWAPDAGVTINLILSAFVHGGWLHLVGNML